MQDLPSAQPLDFRGGSIRFENVNFAYHPDRPIFRNLSFTVPAGKKVAIVGPSGCGKSTIFRLLYRFYEPSLGRIFIDDQDIQKLQILSVRKVIGVVPQDTPLFHADIMHNVRYGRLDASDDEVREAARKANVHNTVIKLPEGYGTQVGERGLMISGGEKQRLAVARVLLKDPPILFFDEAVSLRNALSSHSRDVEIYADLRLGCSNRIGVDAKHQLYASRQGANQHIHRPSTANHCRIWYVPLVIRSFCSGLPCDCLQISSS